MEQQSKSTSSFPLDLTSEILSRLPARSVARFRCVSKLWSSITTDPYFIKSFETWSLRRPSLLLWYINEYKNMFLSSIPQHTQFSNRSYSSSHPIGCYHLKLPCFFFPTESIHGLICSQRSYGPKLIVWNPSKRQLLTLPIPSPKSYTTVFLGYDPVECKHKLVCIDPYMKPCYVCRVLTLGSPQESWRTVRTNHKYCSYHTSGRYIKGFIYYLTGNHLEKGDLILMRFDVRSETFDKIGRPSDIRNDTLVNYQGRLAYIDKNNGRRLWILESVEKHKWSSQDFLLPFDHVDESLRISFKLRGCTQAGEFIYVPTSTSRKIIYIILFDPVRNSCRRFELEGIADDESRLGNGIRNRHEYYLNVFPNHIESQMSL